MSHLGNTRNNSFQLGVKRSQNRHQSTSLGIEFDSHIFTHFQFSSTTVNPFYTLKNAQTNCTCSFFSPLALQAQAWKSFMHIVAQAQNLLHAYPST